ncbi:MAG: phosphoenolpyruvate carboxylase [Candidatus Binataceae bacterium]|nr:phosphoenolpyruvate carboxylase [Candidatus Binataceae bacterium]
MDQAGESNDRGAAAPNPDALAAVLADLRARAAADPFSNPILLFALNLTRRIDRGEITLEGLETLVQDLTVEAFADRAVSLRRYLGETDPAANEHAIKAIIGGLAPRASAGLASAAAFDQFRRRVERSSFGVVFTAHPTFSISLELARALAELAVGADRDGTPLDAAGRAARLAIARRTAHRPPADLTLAVEHQWSVEALHHAHTALDLVNRAALRIARQRWPDRWTTLTPRMVTLATWVGYDQDGRTDITWMRSFALRLADKRAALESHLHTIAGLSGAAEGDFAAALEPIATMLIEALTTVNGQAELLAAAEHDGAETAAFGRAMAAGRSAALAVTKPLEALVDAASARAPDDLRRETLLAMRASLRTHGLGLAHVHVRLNSSQLHNAVRRLVRLDTEPNDPANRRSYFNSINDLLDRVQPAKISFATLIDEQASAKRLIMTVAQMVKFVDAATPIRFLIAETETGFTLLTALYYARLFGVADQIEMSPLFETEEAFERGERVIDEALKSPHYRDYLKRQGRIAVQFGFSDSGRFIGQMAATFRIERLRLRLAQLLERHDLAGLEIILFNTHGESIGRGGHPLTLGDRLRYAAPPASRAEFERRGIRVKEEVSFQGGDGYLRFFTPAAAIASMRRILEFSLVDDPEAINDPIYAAPDYAAEFFATIQQEFTSLVEDPDYTALLGLFRGNLLFRTGSRPVRKRPRAGRGQSRWAIRRNCARFPTTRSCSSSDFSPTRSTASAGRRPKTPRCSPRCASDRRASGAHWNWSARRSTPPTSTCCAPIPTRSIPASG